MADIELETSTIMLFQLATKQMTNLNVTSVIPTNTRMLLNGKYNVYFSS